MLIKLLIHGRFGAALQWRILHGHQPLGQQASQQSHPIPIDSTCKSIIDNLYEDYAIRFVLGFVGSVDSMQ